MGIRKGRTFRKPELRTGLWGERKGSEEEEALRRLGGKKKANLQRNKKRN